MSLFDSEKIDFKCEVCKKNISKSIGWLKTHNHISCTCGTNITVDARQLISETKKIEKQLKDLGFK